MTQPTTYYHFKSAGEYRIQVHQGGTRSGKSFSLLTGLCELCYKNPDARMIITVVRKSFPSLRGSILRDFLEILHREDWYDEANHNKTEQTYELFGNTWEFISADDSQKVRGRKRTIAFLNEANELDLEFFRQISLRTTGLQGGSAIILDYNPSDEYSYIYDEIIPRDDAVFFKTTYKDNPYLQQEVIDEIERLKDTDENYWRIYGLGERGISRETIFQTTTYTTLPEKAKRVAYGLDWGYTNDPTAIVAVYVDGSNLYIDELVYSGGLTNPDIAERLRQLDIKRNDEIVADSAEPKSIDEVHRQGFNIKPAKKGPDSVRVGIDAMRRYKLHIKDTALNTQKEFRNYKWKTDKDGRMLNEPRDRDNHAIDAVRYVCLNKLTRKSGQYYIQ
jgi:phage terminase large subunit